MRDPEELIEAIGGYYIENGGNPRYRIIKGRYVHSLPAGETEDHMLSRHCTCKPQIYEVWGHFIDHRHLGEIPNPSPHTRLGVHDPAPPTGSG